MKNRSNLFLFIMFCVITSLLSSCKKDDTTAVSDPATGQFDGIYSEDQMGNYNLGLITGSKFIYLYYDRDDPNNNYSYLTGNVGIDGSVINHSTVDANGIKVEINLEASIDDNGQMSGTLKATAFGKTSWSGVSMCEIAATKSNVVGGYEGFYAGLVKDPWINSTEDVSFVAVVFGNVIYMSSSVIGIVPGTLNIDGSFSISSERGYMSGRIETSGSLSGTFQFKQGENEDKFQMTGSKEVI